MRAMALLAIVFLVGTAEAVPITQCGQTVPAGDTGDLLNDLVCSDPTGSGVTVGDGATVNLNGFSMTGPGVSGIHCDLLPSGYPGMSRSLLNAGERRLG